MRSSWRRKRDVLFEPRTGTGPLWGLVRSWLAGLGVMVAGLVVGASVASSAAAYSVVGTTILVLLAAVAAIGTALQCYPWRGRPSWGRCFAVGMPVPVAIVVLNVASAGLSGGVLPGTAVGAVVVCTVAAGCVVVFSWPRVKKTDG